MTNDWISYQDSGYFSKLITDYLNQEPKLKPLYGYFPSIENFEKQIELKSQTFSSNTRDILVNSLLEQYKIVSPTPHTLEQIKSLGESTTFTVTTGHQLNIFTGPLYFVYKIISTINLCKQLKSKYPQYNFIPIYWMATEDHDFEEINHFNFRNKKIVWQRNSTGPVGRLSTEGLNVVSEVFAKELGIGSAAEKLKRLFEDTYLKHDNLSDATFHLVHELFKEDGLIIIDADKKSLKQLFIPYIKDEIFSRNSFQIISKTNTSLEGYTIQVHPREINLFYIQDQLRERIIFENDTYKINNTNITFTKDSLQNEIQNNPENFSPNVILRPLYQEVILPNLCYIGGGGEIAYWLQLKANFDHHNVPFPMLLLRNSVLIVSKKQAEKVARLKLDMRELFSPQQELLQKKTKEYSNSIIDFSAMKKALQLQFENLKVVAIKTDKSFKGAVEAQEAKQLKGIDNLEKRLLKAEQRVHKDKLNRIIELQNQLFPNQSLQERKSNFSEYYLEYQDLLFSKLFEELNPLEQKFKVIIY